MDVNEFGTVVATIAATGALEQVGGNVVNRLSAEVVALRERLSSWFSSHGEEGLVMNAALASAGDNPTELSIQMLAIAIQGAAKDDPEGATKIAELVRQLQPNAFVSSPTFNTTATDNAQIGKIYNAGRDLHIDD